MVEERSETVGTYEMLWDCVHCGAKGLLGKSQRHCGECGAMQNPDRRYFPNPGEEKEVVGHTYEGADRKCGSCDAPMSARAKNCTNCGAPMDGSTKEVQGVDAPKPAPPAKRGHRTLWIVLGVIAVLGFAIWLRCIRKRDVEVVLTAHRWTTTIAIEAWSDVEHRAWRNEVPASMAPMTICFREKRTTREVPDGEDCHDTRVDKKDGTFQVVKKCTPRTRSEPVYDDMCRWMQREWQKVDQAKLSGTGTTLGWPTNVPPMPATGANVPLGTRRPGARTQQLDLVFGDQSCDDVNESIWRKYTDKQKVKLEARASSGDLVCSDL